MVSARAGRFTAALLLLALACFGSGVAYAADPREDVRHTNAFVAKSIDAAEAGDLAAARSAYVEYTNAWMDLEHEVKLTSRDSYRAIERAMTGVSAAFAADPLDADQVIASLDALDHEHDLFIDGAPAGGASVTPSSAQPAAQPDTTPTMGGLLGLLADARAALARSDYATATTRLKSFESTWVAVEGEVKTRSANDYRQTETDMGLASGLASQGSPEALTVVDRMAARLQPYQQAQTYGIFDAAIILLREGLEALLVIVALSAFLKKSASVGGQRWLWGGAASGLVGSVALGLAIQASLGAVINPSNREIMEGVIGLFAAGMLVYVSYWLHSKASLGGWQKYINQRTTQAVAGGQLLGLAVLAFLAVFREGAETSLFYLGMASNISNTDLLIGLGLGFGLLAALGMLMVVAGVRIPMRPFFTVASLLVFYLCFKFVGTGIHALQVAGVLPDGSATLLVSVDAIGVYPTWPTTIAQLVLLTAAGWVVLRPRLAPNAVRLARLAAGLLVV